MTGQTPEPGHPAKRPPEWALAPFRQVLDYVEDDQRLLHLSVEGIHNLSRGDALADALQHAAEVLAKTDGHDASDDDRTRYERMKELAGLAKTELGRDFPQLHAHFTVSLWAALESLADDFLLSWIANFPKGLKLTELGRVKVTLSEFVSLTDAERAERVARAIQDELAAGRSGATRLEAIFGAVGFGGSISPELGKQLHELHQVRNAIVHRRGIVDKHLKDECPWLPWAIGESLQLGHEDYERYLTATAEYLTEKAQRIADYFKAGAPAPQNTAV